MSCPEGRQHRYGKAEGLAGRRGVSSVDQRRRVCLSTAISGRVPQWFEAGVAASGACSHQAHGRRVPWDRDKVAGESVQIALRTESPESRADEAASIAVSKIGARAREQGESESLRGGGERW